MSTSELSKQEQDILNRYISRKNTPEPIIPKVTKPFVNQKDFEFSISNLINNGKTFYDGTPDKNGLYIGVKIALENAQKFTETNKGIVATMPYLIAGKVNAYKTDSKGIKSRDTSNYLWADWLTALSEEYVGTDEKGILVGRGKPVVITLHGGGILTPKRIGEAYSKGLTSQNAAKLENLEFSNLLKGTLPNGENIQIYTIDDVKQNNIPNPFGKYAIALDFDTAKKYSSGYHNEKDFLANELVLARAGILDYLKDYFNLAKQSNNTVGCWHRFNEIDSSVSQGRLLFLSNDYFGLSGYYLGDYGRFVGVAPEAHRTKK